MDKERQAKTIKETFSLAAEKDAQDIFLIEGEPPIFRVNGVINRMRILPVWERETFDLFTSKLFGASGNQIDNFFETFLEKMRKIRNKNEENGGFTSYDFNTVYGNSNLRCHMYTAQPKGKLADKNRKTQLIMNIRVIPQEIPFIEELNLPDISPIFQREQGLLLISGRAGDGKSTTMSAIVNEFNHATDRSRVILTIEDPIEFIHSNHNAYIIQKRVGDNVESYAKATEDALREDAHIVVLGELRGETEMRNAIRLAEVGKLVIATIHSNGVADTIERYVGEFSGKDAKDQIRARLLSNLCGIIHQNLITVGGEQYPLVSMCLVNSKQVEQEIRNLNSREEFEAYLENNVDNEYILSRKDGFNYLVELGVLEESNYSDYFMD